MYFIFAEEGSHGMGPDGKSKLDSRLHFLIFSKFVPALLILRELPVGPRIRFAGVTSFWCAPWRIPKGMLFPSTYRVHAVSVKAPQVRCRGATSVTYGAAVTRALKKKPKTQHRQLIVTSAPRACRYGSGHAQMGAFSYSPTFVPNCCGGPLNKHFCFRKHQIINARR